MIPASEETNILTPGHFLIGQPQQPDITAIAQNRLSRWQLLLQTQQHLRNRGQQNTFIISNNGVNGMLSNSNAKISDANAVISQCILFIIRDSILPPELKPSDLLSSTKFS